MKLEIISRYPAVSTHSTPLLFVHGAWHGAWCWDAHFLDYFVQHGYAAHALDLRGHGNSEGHDNLRWTRIADYVGDLADAVRQLPNPPVLVGHSMGSFIIQKYLEDHAAPAAVLLTPPPPAGLFAPTLRLALRHPLIFARVNLTFNLYPLVATAGLARENFFSEGLADELVQEYRGRLQPESYRAFLDMIALDLLQPGKGKTPLLVLGGSRDKMLKPDEIEATARTCNAQYEIIADVAHDMMLESRWQAVAARILVWLKEREL
jgi:pimeloyl-ACP methyl ester carboxylesterase